MIAPTSSVTLTPRDLRRWALTLRHANGVLQGERLGGLRLRGNRKGEGEDEETHKALHEWGGEA